MPKGSWRFVYDGFDEVQCQQYQCQCQEKKMKMKKKNNKSKTIEPCNRITCPKTNTPCGGTVICNEKGEWIGCNHGHIIPVTKS